MDKKLFVSFVSPCYNVNRYLGDYFDSYLPLKKEGKIDFEIIVIDDRGQDDPYEVVKKYEKQLPIKFIKNSKNLGLGFSRNVGLDNVSKDATHVMYIDSDDMIEGTEWVKDLKLNTITWFDEMIFDTVTKYKRNRLKNFGKNLFNNSACGVAMPTKIAKEFRFETRSYEDLLVNRRLIKKYKDEIELSDYAVMAYRSRLSGINNSKPTAEKFKDFMANMERLINEDINTYRFNIQEIYQYYWMWRKHLKKDLKAKELTPTKWYYKAMFWWTGSMIRWLHLERMVYGRGNPNAFK